MAPRSSAPNSTRAAHHHTKPRTGRHIPQVEARAEHGTTLNGVCVRVVAWWPPVAGQVPSRGPPKAMWQHAAAIVAHHSVILGCIVISWLVGGRVIIIIISHPTHHLGLSPPLPRGRPGGMQHARARVDGAEMRWRRAAPDAVLAACATQCESSRAPIFPAHAQRHVHTTAAAHG